MTEIVSEATDLGLTADQVQSFKDNGFIGPFDLYPEDEAPVIWNQAMIEMATSKNKPHNSTVINYDRHLDCDTLSQHVGHPAIVHKLRSLMGDDVLLWKTNIFEKPPGSSGTGWHQVETHMVYESATVARPSLEYTEESTNAASQELTVWTAFSPASTRHACLRFIRGSHKRWYYDETRPMAFNAESKSHDFFGYDYSELKLDNDWDPNKADIVNMEMKAGQFVIFVAKCVHGSTPNTSDVRRLAYAGRYVAPSVRVYEHTEQVNNFGGSIDLHHHGNVLVAGEDRYGHNRIIDRNLNGSPFPRVTTDGH